jgi:hypothetical protein
VVTSTEWMGRASVHDAMHAVLVADAGLRFCGFSEVSASHLSSWQRRPIKDRHHGLELSVHGGSPPWPHLDDAAGGTRGHQGWQRSASSRSSSSYLLDLGSKISGASRFEDRLTGARV